MKKILFLILVFAGLISSAQTPIPDSLKSKVVLGSMLWLKYNGATWDTLGLFPDSIPSIWSNSGKIGVDTIYFKDDGTKQWTAASGTGGSDTGYVKTTGDSMYSDYTSFNGSWLWTGTTGATPASGAGTRMMWIPAKGAFRAGSISTTQWDDASIGVNSFGVGQSGIASGDYSTTFGIDNIASEYASTAFGELTEASGYYAISIGESTVASGFTSFAGGQTTKANGDFAFTHGNATISNSYLGVVFGRYNDTTISSNLTAWILTDPIFQIGNGGGIPLTYNDAFRILKNGKTYIGDMSSTTDAIMIVDPTDSTVAVIGTLTTDHLITPDTVTLADALAELDSITINDLTIFPKDTAIADDGTIIMANGLFGFGEAFLFNAGTLDQYAKFYWNSDGSVVLLDYSMDVVNTDTDGKFCIFDNGTGITIRNRMGGVRIIKLKLNY